MGTFIKWVEENHLEEGLGRNLVAAGLMGIGALGSTGCSVKDAPTNPITNQTSTSQDASSYLNGNDGKIDQNYHWSSEIGRYTLKQTPGGAIYQSKNGNFKRVPSRLHPTGYKFVKI